MAFADNRDGGIILDTGSDSQPATLTLAGTCVVGDILGYSSGWKRTLGCVSDTVIQPRFVAYECGVSGDVIPVGINCVVGGRYSGATAGDVVYISDASGATNAGLVVTTVGPTTGDSATPIGIALTATEIQFFLNARVDALSAT